ncbi:hypothetical protein NP233_g12863 [Leucocoprinus birnbaumii]|uniref:Uncharacterized protein n=1 Tax=Leucocoprinus birnbaumii TaxID=56174 RepID=A0AAD5VDV3_9AGAR|nr:hypothetical protein NP233_g12863 [Leucocoprinus birnbaumii]
MVVISGVQVRRLAPTLAWLWLSLRVLSDIPSSYRATGSVTGTLQHLAAASRLKRSSKCFDTAIRPFTWIWPSIGHSPFAGLSKASRVNGDDVRSSEGTYESIPPPGFFANASHFVVQQLTNVTLNNTNDMFANGNTVLNILAPYTNPEAAVDSSARWPPPKCHPGTRVTIGATLMSWLHNESVPKEKEKP